MPKCGKHSLYILLSILLIWAVFAPVQAQPDSLSQPQQQHREKVFLISSGAAYAVGMTGLYQLWYKDQSGSQFHFFNDNNEWLQVDKWGHLYTAFHLAKGAQQAFQWSGVPHKKAAFYSMLYSSAMMIPIEVFDGFSERYGASWGDAVADVVGAGLPYAQESLWGEIRIHPKFSYHQTAYPALRPNVLGSQWTERLLKDYNGQTYWLSVDVADFLKEGNTWPQWLQVSLGTGGERMVYATPSDNENAGYEAFRQYYLSLDVNWEKIPTERPWLRKLFYVLNMLKLPAPTLSLAKGQWQFHPIYH